MRRFRSVLTHSALNYFSTDESSADRASLCEAIESLKRTVSGINEAKRKTEGLVAMFDIINPIENCPPDLLSAQV